MLIKITQHADQEEVTVEVIYPPSEVVSTTALKNGQSVTLTAIPAHQASDIEVGEIVSVEESESDNG